MTTESNQEITIIHGDCLEKLKELPDNSVDAIVTDPPYGLSFMGKKWDYDVPSQEIWEQCFRVLKHGGHLLSFAGTRTQHRMAVRIEDAGFEIRDMIAWVYGSGFPKSHNLKDEWQGWGTALKPALEPITIARKPPIGTVAANVLAHGTGALNIDGCRVGTDDAMSGSRNPSANTGAIYGVDKGGTYEQHAQGRWPANLIHDGSDEVVAGFPSVKTGAVKPYKTTHNPDLSPASFSKGMGVGTNRDFTQEASDGSAARFFYCAKASKRDRDEGLEGFEAKLQANAHFRPNHLESALNGDSGKPHGRYTARPNNHPTVKPTDLMRYLCRLVTPPNGVVLDPFMGSGSTGKAARLEGFGFIGIEREAEYIEIAKARIDAAVKVDLFT